MNAPLNASLNAPPIAAVGCQPRCFNSPKQYQEWRKYATRASAGENDFCADCTPDYQEQMILQRRCAHPKTQFFIDSHGFVEGRRPLEERLVNCRKKGRR